LVRAFARVERPVRLVVVGEGRERARLEGLAGQLGVAEAVSFPGHTHNPYAYMGRASVVVLSSVREGLPTVLIEALALSRRVVAFDCVAGPREILEGGRHGTLVPPGNEEALAAAIDSALSAGPAAIPEAALARYDPERVADRYLELLSA
jgi:glycosyltransferase involved in cell wall biosynthesis